MAKILNGTMSILPKLQTEFGNVLLVEISFSTEDKNFQPEKDVRLEFKKNNERFAPPPEAIGQPDVNRKELNQFVIKWALHTESLGEGAFEVQAVSGTDIKIHDRPERFFVLQSVAQELRRAAELTAPGVAAQFAAAAPTEVSVSFKDVIQTSGVAASTSQTSDIYLWLIILATTEGLTFTKFDEFVQGLCDGDMSDRMRTAVSSISRNRTSPFTGGDGYALLKSAAEAFVMVNCGVDTTRLMTDPGNSFFPSNSDELAKALNRLKSIQIKESDLNALKDKYLIETSSGGASQHALLPYLSVIANRAGIDNAIVGGCRDQTNFLWCYQQICKKLLNPCLLELIWSYWHEEGMLVQTMNAIARRFQNIRTAGLRDPLTGLEISFLRPLNNLLWGYIQDEQHRLTVVRRNYEYDHHYGLCLRGKAVEKFSPADSRSKFTASFNQLLTTAAHFFEQSNNTMIVPDPFPLLNALKELHFILSEGAHNQYGDLPSTARVEMLTQQWILARPEFSQFLPTRASVAYPEAWMDRVATMSNLQGWNNPPILNFYHLARCGERILLGVRLGHWSDVTDSNQAANWAKFFREEIQQYIHAYRAVTGVDFSGQHTSGKVDATLPSELLAVRRNG